MEQLLSSTQPFRDQAIATRLSDAPPPIPWESVVAATRFTWYIFAFDIDDANGLAIFIASNSYLVFFDFYSFARLTIFLAHG